MDYIDTREPSSLINNVIKLINFHFIALYFQEKCEWECKHSKCKKHCGEKCSRDPCNEPCPEKLKCGHECVGFCGDPCPPLCRVCDYDELTDLVLLGNEDEPDAR